MPMMTYVHNRVEELTGCIVILHHSACMYKLEGVRGKLCIVRQLLTDDGELRVRWWQRKVQPGGSIRNASGERH